MRFMFLEALQPTNQVVSSLHSIATYTVIRRREHCNEDWHYSWFNVEDIELWRVLTLTVI